MGLYSQLENLARALGVDANPGLDLQEFGRVSAHAVRCEVQAFLQRGDLPETRQGRLAVRALVGMEAATAGASWPEWLRDDVHRLAYALQEDHDPEETAERFPAAVQAVRRLPVEGDPSGEDEPPPPVTAFPSQAWTPLRAHPQQLELWTTRQRFTVAACGRRSGKSELARRRITREALTAPPWVADWLGYLAAPTWQQSKDLHWLALKRLLRGLTTEVRDGDLELELINGARLRVIGMEKPERAEGRAVDWFVLDEFADMKPSVWFEHLRPACSTVDRPGGGVFTSTPEGRNHLFDLFKNAQGAADWLQLSWPSSDIIAAEELEAARHDLDERSFRQEYEASFELLTGRAYYSFEPDLHAAARLPYDKNAPIGFCFDFNVEPGVAVIVQEAERFAGDGLPENVNQRYTAVIDEVHIRQDSNTIRVLDALLEKYGDHRGPVRVYADATGGARGTAQVDGSDLDLIRRRIRREFSRASFKVPNSNPAERARVNAVNSRLRSMSGEIRLLVDPWGAPNTAEDLEGVRLDDEGGIDKRHDKRLTHLSDALGYYVAREFPVKSRGEAGSRVML